MCLKNKLTHSLIVFSKFSIANIVKNFANFAFKPTIMEILRHHNFLCKR